MFTIILYHPYLVSEVVCILLAFYFIFNVVFFIYVNSSVCSYFFTFTFTQMATGTFSRIVGKVIF